MKTKTIILASIFFVLFSGLMHARSIAVCRYGLDPSHNSQFVFCPTDQVSGSISSYCGDRICDALAGENPLTCPEDCSCNNNGFCEIGETPQNCPNDCPCGNGFCETGEAITCPFDCIPGPLRITEVKITPNVLVKQQINPFFTTFRYTVQSFASTSDNIIIGTRFTLSNAVTGEALEVLPLNPLNPLLQCPATTHLYCPPPLNTPLFSFINPDFSENTALIARLNNYNEGSYKITVDLFNESGDLVSSNFDHFTIVPKTTNANVNETHPIAIIAIVLTIAFFVSRKKNLA